MLARPMGEGSSRRWIWQMRALPTMSYNWTRATFSLIHYKTATPQRSSTSPSTHMECPPFWLRFRSGRPASVSACFNDCSSKIASVRGLASLCQKGGCLAAFRRRPALRGPSSGGAGGAGKDVKEASASGWAGGSFMGGAGMVMDLVQLRQVVVIVLKCVDECFRRTVAVSPGRLMELQALHMLRLSAGSSLSIEWRAIFQYPGPPTVCTTLLKPCPLPSTFDPDSVSTFLLLLKRSRTDLWTRGSLLNPSSIALA